jgi:hypothetical protein
MHIFYSIIQEPFSSAPSSNVSIHGSCSDAPSLNVSVHGSCVARFRCWLSIKANNELKIEVGHGLWLNDPVVSE